MVYEFIRVLSVWCSWISQNTQEYARMDMLRKYFQMYRCWSWSLAIWICWLNGRTNWCEKHHYRPSAILWIRTGTETRVCTCKCEALCRAGSWLSFSNQSWRHDLQPGVKNTTIDQAQSIGISKFGSLMTEIFFNHTVWWGGWGSRFLC